jgi:hypothetical protein
MWTQNRGCNTKWRKLNNETVILLGWSNQGMKRATHIAQMAKIRNACKKLVW